MTRSQIDSIVSAKKRYDNAIRTRLGVNVAKEQLKTVMFNCHPDLIDMLRSEDTIEKVKAGEVAELRSQIDELKSDIESLQMSLQQADNENDDLRKELNALKQKRKIKAADANGET